MAQFNIATGALNDNQGKDIVEAVVILDETGAVVNSLGGGSNGVARTPSLVFVSDSGTIPAGSKSITVSNTGSNPGILMGASIPAGLTFSFSVDNLDTLGSITYDATSTTFLIARVV